MTYVFIEGNQAHTSGANGPVTRIVMHATVSPCERGGARSVARYFQSPQAGGLAHYVVDPSEVVQCCKEDVCAWHAPPNHGSIGVELCDPMSGPDSRWTDDPHARMLARAAVLVADLCKRLGVPVVYVDAAGLSAGRHGITTHAEVSAAFHQSDHTDPGPAFPMARFLDLVRAANQPAVKPTPAPTPPPPQPTVKDKDMALLVKDPSSSAQWCVATDLSSKTPIADHQSLAALQATGAHQTVALTAAQLGRIPTIDAKPAA
ncbi:MAG: N-acetylmuramoyl-L-alanine amidase [Blastococcus sp.]